MNDEILKKYKPTRITTLSFGVFREHSCDIKLHPNSRVIAHKINNTTWEVMTEKYSFRVEDYLFHSLFMKV